MARSLRHRLIRWLSHGDMILMNAEISTTGVLRTRETGGALIENVRVDHRRERGIGINAPGAGISLETTRTQSVNLIDCFVFGLLPDGFQ